MEREGEKEGRREGERERGGRRGEGEREREREGGRGREALQFLMDSGMLIATFSKKATCVVLKTSKDPQFLSIGPVGN